MKTRKFTTFVLSLVLLFALSINASAATLTDIQGHWAEPSITWAVDKGLVSGYPDGTFQPDGNITRAEYVRILNQFIKADKTAEVSFTDIKGTWYEAEVKKAVKVGFVKDGTSFNGDERINRDEAFRMLAYVYDLTGNKELLAPFTDKDIVVNEAAVAGLLEKGIVTGYPDNTLRTNTQITRAEVTRIFYVANDKLGEAKVSYKATTPTSKATTSWYGGGPIVGRYREEPSSPIIPVTPKPSDSEIKSDFNKALVPAVLRIGESDSFKKVATVTMEEGSKAAEVLVKDSSQVVGAVKDTGAIVELQKLIKENGLISYEITAPGKADKVDLVSIADDSAELKKNIVNSFAAAAGLDADFTAEQLIGKTFTAKVEIKKDGKVVADEYSVTVKEDPKVAELKKDFNAALVPAVNRIAGNLTDLAGVRMEEGSRAAEACIKDETKLLGEVSGTNAIVELQGLIKDKGLVEYTIIEPNAAQTVVVAGKINAGEDQGFLKKSIIDSFTTALGAETDLKASDLLGKTFKARIKVEKDGYVAIDTYEITVTRCPESVKLQEDFNDALVASVGNINNSEGFKNFAEVTLEKGKKEAVLKVKDLDTVVAGLENTGAIVELQKLIAENGLVEYTITKPEKAQTVSVEGKVNAGDQAYLKQSIVDSFTRALNATTDLKASDLLDKTFEAEIVLKKDGNVIKDTYSVRAVRGENLVQDEADLKEKFNNALEAELAAIKFPEEVATRAYDKATKTMTVTVKKPDEVVANLSETGAIVALERLINEKGLLSYEITAPKAVEKVEVAGKTQEELKVGIINSFMAASDAGTDFTLKNLIGKTFTANVEVEKDGIKATDTYSVIFNEEATEPAPTPTEKGAYIESLKANPILMTASYYIGLENITFEEIDEIRVDSPNLSEPGSVVNDSIVKRGTGIGFVHTYEKEATENSFTLILKDKSEVAVRAAK